VEKRIKQKDGCYENFYNVEMIFALAFLLDTVCRVIFPLSLIVIGSLFIYWSVFYRFDCCSFFSPLVCPYLLRSVEMIFALAFLLDTYPADRLRKYLITKAVKENAAPFVCIIGKNHSYLKC